MTSALAKSLSLLACSRSAANFLASSGISSFYFYLIGKPKTQDAVKIKKQI